MIERESGRATELAGGGSARARARAPIEWLSIWPPTGWLSVLTVDPKRKLWPEKSLLPANWLVKNQKKKKRERLIVQQCDNKINVNC